MKGQIREGHFNWHFEQKIKNGKVSIKKMTLLKKFYLVEYADELCLFNTQFFDNPDKYIITDVEKNVYEYVKDFPKMKVEADEKGNISIPKELIIKYELFDDIYISGCDEHIIICNKEHYENTIAAYDLTSVYKKR